MVGWKGGRRGGRDVPKKKRDDAVTRDSRMFRGTGPIHFHQFVCLTASGR